MNEIRQNGTVMHVPVMPQEVISHLDIKKDGIYVDGTIGLGGHSQLILSQLSEKGRLIGFDRDEEALEICKKRLSPYHSSLSLFRFTLEAIKRSFCSSLFSPLKSPSKVKK